MANRSKGTLIVVGLTLAMVSLLADSIGLGQSEGFGLNQMVGTVLGFVILLVGVRLWKAKPTVGSGQPSSDEEGEQVSRMQDEGGPG